MKIFTFTSVIQNYCAGQYYFAAEDVADAIDDAMDFATDHNKKVYENINYIIRFEVKLEDLLATAQEVKRGFLPLNRMVK